MTHSSSTGHEEQRCSGLENPTGIETTLDHAIHLADVVMLQRT